MSREDDVLLTVAEAADVLDVNPATVWRYIKAADLTPARNAKPYMLWQSDVVAFKPHAKKRRGPKPGHGGRPRKSSPFAYPEPGEHRATGRLLRAAEDRPPPTTP